MVMVCDAIEGKGYEWCYLISRGRLAVMTVYVRMLGVDIDDSSLKWYETKRPLYMYKYSSTKVVRWSVLVMKLMWVVPRIE
jgi:hypothetical protein